VTTLISFFACLIHDIGYVRGIVYGDEDGSYIVDVRGRTIQLPIGSSDAALAPYHVDRSKIFAAERLDPVEENAARVARAIEYTRFPYTIPPRQDSDDLDEEEGLLVRAADLIGQLGDPNYMKKSNALFHEFEEIGLNKVLGQQTSSTNTLRSTGPRRAADSSRHSLSQCDLKRTAMDSKPVQ